MAFIKYSIGKIASVIEGEVYLEEQLKKVQDENDLLLAKKQEVNKTKKAGE